MVIIGCRIGPWVFVALGLLRHDILVPATAWIAEYLEDVSIVISSPRQETSLGCGVHWEYRLIKAPTCFGILLAGWTLAACPPAAPAPIEGPAPLRRITGPLGTDRVYICVDLSHLTSLGSSGDPASGIRSLEGLQYALNLETLALPRNHIQDLTPLQGLPRLTSLDLAENEISELTPLAGLPGLRESNLRGLDLGVVRYVGEENFSPVMREPPSGDTYRFAVPVVSADLA